MKNLAITKLYQCNHFCVVYEKRTSQGSTEAHKNTTQ